jgi:hypothetical protein
MLPIFAPPGSPNPEDLIKLYMESKSMNYAVVQNGVVVNIIDWDGSTPYSPAEGCELHQWGGPINIGWAWVDGAPVDPNPPPPLADPAAPSDGPTVL